jgi:hypothetical protein
VSEGGEREKEGGAGGREEEMGGTDWWEGEMEEGDVHF